MKKNIMKCYGYLFGVIKLIKDTHHDEVFIDKHNYVIIRNGLRLIDYTGLVAIAREMGVNPYRLTIIEYNEKEWSKLWHSTQENNS